MEMIATVKRNIWTIWGIEIGNLKSTWENCFITDKDMTELEVIQTIQPEYMKDGMVATSARLDEQEEIKIDLLTKEIVK